MGANIILTGNKLIAEFMGGIYNINPVNLKPYDDKIVLNNVTKYFENRGFGDYIKYHKSWSWLMPVVDKIEGIKDIHHGYFGVYINSNSCTIQGTNLRTNVKQEPPIYYSEFTLDNKLKSTYIAVIEFIKWYNNEKS